MRQYYTKSVTTPASTLSTAPQQTVWPLIDGHLLSLEVLIPAGHAGLTGISVKAQGVQIVPWGTSEFLVADDTTIPVWLDYDIANSGLVILTYNTGAYSHTHYLRASVETLAPPGIAHAPDIALALPPVYTRP